VVRVEDTNIVILDDENENIELGTLSLTAANLRQPLASMIAAANSLTASLERNEDHRVRSQLREINRNLCRIHRMLCNMSDAVMYSNGSSRMVCANVVSVVEEVFKKTQQVCSNCGIRLEYSVPNESILCLIDEDLLERSIYNMLSNAIKFSDEGSVVKAELTTRDHRIYISVQNQGNGVPPSALNNIFKRYQREPGIEEGRVGLGLGLVLVRSAAKIHKGIILIDQPDQSGTRVTLSFPIRQHSTAMLRSTITRIDYASGWDHSLLELSDALPSSLY
jgi:K+-sensing histidine kinase KdpD